MSIIRMVQLDTRNEPLVPLAEKVLADGVTLSGDTYGINVDPPYQRAPVWGDERKRNLIRSILMGLPIGVIIFNERSYPEWRVCVDGKQRLLAVRDFITGQLAVPREWWRDGDVEEAVTGDTVTWNELTKRGRRIFDADALVATHTGKLRGATTAETEALECELFNLINYGGVPQGESDV